MSHESELARIDLPEFGTPDREPDLDAGLYRDRLGALRERARANEHDAFVVYGDREHFANLAYLTGYDPRFEEALLVVDADGDRRPTLLVGNEGEGYADTSPVRDDLEVVLFQSFSLVGQDRSESDDLRSILRSAGIDRGMSVGLAGWKHFTREEFEAPETTFEVPAYLVAALRELVGESGRLRNENAVLMDSADGLRAHNEVDQIAWFEFAAAHTSAALRRVLFGLEPGTTEYEAVRLMEYTGLPLSCHLMLSSGERAHAGLPSPSGRTIERGDPLTMAYGAWGALNARAGFVAAGPADLPDAAADYVDRLVAPYFEAVAAWYERVGIGVRGGELYDAIHDRIGADFFGVELNPGHLIHLDEWIDSPVYEGSGERLRSGMALQVDVIPATGTPYFTTNVEDGIVLADGELRAALADAYPDAFERIQRRRSFVTDTIGIDLAPEVLPLSNIPAYLPPYLLSPDRAMRIVD